MVAISCVLTGDFGAGHGDSLKLLFSDWSPVHIQRSCEVSNTVPSYRTHDQARQQGTP